MKFKAICFDMDGVIINSEPTHFKAFNTTMLNHGHTLTHDEYASYFAGMTDKKGFEGYVESIGLDTPIETLMNEKSLIYQRLLANIEPYPNTLVFLRSLIGTVPLALVTGSTRNEAEAVLRSLALHDAFPVVVSADDVAHGKPEPEGYIVAANALGVPAKDCVVIEDSPSGISAAKRAGMYCIAITTTHTIEELALADDVVDTLNVDLVL